MLRPTAWRVLRLMLPVALVGAVSAGATPWHGLSAPAFAMPQQQTVQAATGIGASMHDNALTWRTTPSTVVQAQLREGTTVRANGQPSVSDAQGFVRIQFGGAGGGMGGGGNNRGPFINSGYTIALTPQGAAEQTAAVPDLAADIDIDGDKVVGKAPAGASVDVVLNAGPNVTAAMTNTVTAAADGTFSTSFSGRDLVAGHGGQATITTADGNTFSARYVALNATAAIGARSISGSVTPGDRVNVGFSAPDGAARGRGQVATVRPTANWNVAAGGGGGGGGGGGPTALQPLRVGDTVTVTVTSALPGGTRTLRGVAPAVYIDQVSTSDRKVVGRAPAGMKVTVEALSPFGGTPPTATATSAADGTFNATMPGTDPIGPGWRIRVGVEVAPGLTIVTIDAIEQVRVGIHTSQVTGVADPGTLVTVTLRAANGTQKAVDDDVSNNAGAYGVGFGGANAIAIGDRVEVNFVAGDPIIIPVGNVTAMTDKASDRVSGEAPAGTTVTVSRQQGGQTTRKTVPVDASGQYVADFAGTLDIDDPMAGEVAVRLLSGHELVSSWAAVRMSLEINDTFVSGNGPTSRSASLQLVDNKGVVVATGVANIGGGGGGPGGGGAGGFGGNWFVNLTDTTDQPVRIQVGDTLRATVGDDMFNLVVPELRGVAFVADDLVNGVTSPAKTVGIDVVRPLVGDDATAETVSDGTGNFSHSFSGTFDLQHNDSITFNIDEGGHTILSQIFVPGLRLDLDTGTLVGSWRPLADVAITVLSGGRTLYTGSAKTDVDAIFSVTMVDGTGERVRPKQGDVVRVVPAGAPAETLEMTIPELSVAFDEEANSVSGRATPGGHLELNVGDAIARPVIGGGPGMGGGGFGGNRNAEPTINADGTWTQSFQPPYNVQPGSRANLIYRVPIGHRVSMTRYVPILVAQHGGSHACGLVGTPRDAVTADLNDAGGASLGHAEGPAGYNSQFDFELAKGGTPVTTAAGQIVKAKLGTKDVSVTLPALTVSVNWTTGQLTGTLPAGTIVLRKFPAGGCLDLTGGGPGGGGGAVQFALTNAQGRFQFQPIPGFQRDPGDGFEIGLFTADGHYVYRHAYRARGEVYVHTDRVTGQALPSSPVVVTVKAADGTTRGSAAGVANAAGRFDVRVKDAGGQALSLEPGMTVHLEASGDTADIAVEELDFDWSPGPASTIRGTTTADRQIRVYLRLASGRTIGFDRGSDPSGAFSFGVGDVPPRADWSMADVTGVRIETDTTNGHILVAETGDSVGPVPTPTRPPTTGGNQIYLPFGYRYKR